MLTIRSRVILSVTVGMLVAGIPATGAFAAEVAPPPAPEAPIGPSEVPVYPVPSPLESEAESDWHPLPTPDPAQPAPVLQAPPPVDLTSGLEAAWASNHPPVTAQAPSAGGGAGGGVSSSRSEVAVSESAQSAGPVEASPLVAPRGPRMIPSEADLGLWLRLEPAAVRSSPESAAAEFAAKGDIRRAADERRSATANLTRMIVVLVGGVLALGAVVGAAVLPRLRTARRT